MSAFILEDEHITGLIRAGLWSPRHGPLRWSPSGSAPGELTTETADRVGRMLLAQNYRSVNHRYAEQEPEARIYRFPKPKMIGGLIEDITGKAPDPSPVTPVAVLKSIGCYEYQACEDEGWEASEAKAFCDALRHKMISLLPGYEAANWGAPGVEAQVTR